MASEDYMVIETKPITEKNSKKLSRELRKLWSMMVTETPFVIGILETIPDDLEKDLKKFEIRGRILTIETAEL